MPRGYKVRLGDGSEIGPLDNDMLRSWYQQGLIEDESPVQPVGARSWTKLSRVVDVKAWGGPPRIRVRRRSPREASADLPGEGRTQRWVGVAAAAILLLAGAIAGAFAILPTISLPDLDGAPWREIALGLVLLGLTLAAGWSFARRLVRVAVLLLSFALFPVAGLLAAQGERGRVYLILLAAWVLATGLVALLAPGPLSGLHAGLAAAAAAAGLGGAAYLGYVPPGVGHRQVQEHSSTQRRYVDAASGLRAQLPEGWYVVDPGKAHPLVPTEAKLRLAHPRLSGFGYLQAEEPGPAISTLDQYADRLVARRRALGAALKEAERSDLGVGRLPGRLLSGTWTDAEGTFREDAVVWRDGWTYFALVAWAPASRGARLDSEFRALTGGFAPDGRATARIHETTIAVSRELPCLSPAAVERLLAQRSETNLSVPAACRRGWQAALAGRAALDELETREMARFDALMLAALERREKQRFAGYLERVRLDQPTSADDDAEMAGLTKAAVLALPESSRVRLQALNEKALRSGAR